MHLCRLSHYSGLDASEGVMCGEISAVVMSPLSCLRFYKVGPLVWCDVTWNALLCTKYSVSSQSNRILCGGPKPERQAHQQNVSFPIKKNCCPLQDRRTPMWSIVTSLEPQLRLIFILCSLAIRNPILMVCSHCLQGSHQVLNPVFWKRTSYQQAPYQGWYNQEKKSPAVIWTEDFQCKEVLTWNMKA